MSPMTLFLGIPALLFLFASSIWAMQKDKRACDRCIIVLSLLAQVFIIAFHALYDPVTTMVAAICIEGYLAIQVIKSTFPQRTQYSALLFASIVLSFLWGLDYSAGTGLLYAGSEPSLYTFMAAVLTIMQGLIFIRAADGTRRNADDNGRILRRHFTDNKGGH